MASSRRSFVLGSAVLGAASFWGSPARATLVRGLSLKVLVSRSQQIVLLKPLDAHSHYVTLGGRRSIVTDTRVSVEDWVAKESTRQSELLVRTLGGRVGSVGELVHGQPELEPARTCLAFLKSGPEGVQWFVGMAQGHYRLENFPAANARLLASRNLPELQDWNGSAVQQLTGQRLHTARVAITGAAVL